MPIPGNPNFYPIQPQIAPQFIQPPMIQQPSIMVADKITTDTTFDEPSYEINIDHEKNRIFLLKSKKRIKQSDTQGYVNGVQSSHVQRENDISSRIVKIEIAKGTITIVSKSIKPTGEFLSVKLKGENGEITERELTFD